MTNRYEKNSNFVNKFFQKAYIFHWSVKLYNFLLRNIKIILYVSLVISIAFGMIRTIFYIGFNVDSYQFYALSIEKYILTGKMDYLFINYYQRYRIMYPFIIAITHMLFPMDISILACFINLFFGLLSIYIIRKILFFYGYKEKDINLFSIFLVLSYNFINFCFNIFTDFVSLAFFLLFFYYLIKFKKDKKILDLVFACYYFIFAVFAREQFVLAIFLFLYLIDSRKIRLIILVGLIVVILILLLLIPEKIPFMGQFVPPAYWSVYINSDILKLYFLLQKKWVNPGYMASFFKGLLKVGILPAIIFLLLLNWKNLSLKNIKKFTIMNPNGDILFGWFIIFLTLYSVFYSNVSSASGLRYWLPISWVLLIFVSTNISKDKISKVYGKALSQVPMLFIDKSLTQKKVTKTINFLVILFFCLYPIAWSSMEIYVNRDIVTGTGSLIAGNIYINEMNERGTITKIDYEDIWFDQLNDSYFKTTLKKELGTTNDFDSIRGRFILFLWLNVTESLEIRISLKSINEGRWGFVLYEVSDTYAPKIGEAKFAKQNLLATSDFEEYYFRLETSMMLRYIALTVNGPVNSAIIWDYLIVEYI